MRTVDAIADLFDHDEDLASWLCKPGEMILSVETIHDRDDEDLDRNEYAVRVTIGSEAEVLMLWARMGGSRYTPEGTEVA